MDVVELGGIRLHVLRVHPGLPHEADRVSRELQKLAPAVILADVDTGDALRLRAALAEKKPFEAGFVDALFAAETFRRYAGDAKLPEHPLAAAAKFARDRRSEFIPLRAIVGKPGFFARRRARKAAERVEAPSHDAFGLAFANALTSAKAWDPASEIEAAHRRLVRALTEGRAPVVAIVQAHRADAYMGAVRATGRIAA